MASWWWAALTVGAIVDIVLAKFTWSLLIRLRSRLRRAA